MIKFLLELSFSKIQDLDNSKDMHLRKNSLSAYSSLFEIWDFIAKHYITVILQNFCKIMKEILTKNELLTQLYNKINDLITKILFVLG